MIKTVLTAAGRGTRLLPFTKEMPKEMMPIFTKIHKNQHAVIPLLQYIFEQFYSMKIRDYCFVVGRDKRSIKDHFSLQQSNLNELSKNHKNIMSIFYKKLKNCHLTWVNQNTSQMQNYEYRLENSITDNNSKIIILNAE